MKESILRTSVILPILKNELIDYPTPVNLSYMWGFGLLAGICLAVQLITGIFLAMHYTPHVDLAFDSVEHIMRDVNYGWLLRYAHSNGASMFFIVVYIHIGRGLYYGSYLYPRRLLWSSGILIFLLMMGTGFIGYVLPWGQMSFWGATVITNLVTVIPYIGEDIVHWLWGGFSVDNATLNRFFSLHYLLPFVILGLVLLHLILLHIDGSGNPLYFDNYNRISFYPYFYVKDLFGFILFLIFFSYFVFFIPNYLGHSDNYIRANPMVTPTHIVPEWYFLPFYAILRSIPNKLNGVIAMVAAILILAVLFLNPVFAKSSQFRFRYKLCFWSFVCNFLLLGWLGAQPVEYPYTELGYMAFHAHFLYFLFFVPYANFWDSNMDFYWWPWSYLNKISLFFKKII